METVVRKSFQGVSNIIRFNWHFYALACVLIICMMVTMCFANGLVGITCSIVIAGIVLSTSVSLAVSYYIYDYSTLYAFDWLRKFKSGAMERIVNIHAGFDETSAALALNFPQAELHVFDFYDPAKHTERSIARARKIYAPYPTTIQIKTDSIPLKKNFVDLLFAIFALHEVRDRQERIGFLQCQRAILKDEGTCIVVEHLRDLPNFFAYNIGFFHFLSASEWNITFSQAGFRVVRKFKITPFVNVFILKKDSWNHTLK